jgi:transmembrane sensor
MIHEEGGHEDEARTIQDEAVEWLVKMRGPDAPALRGQFEQWLASSPEHRREHAWASQHFGDAAILKQSERHGIATHRSRPAARWLIAGTLAAAAASLIVVVVGNPFERGQFGAAPGLSPSTSPLVTARGEIRTFRLADGSSVTLDTDSKLVVSMDASSRHLDLERGKARFTVARDPRPFEVSAGAGMVSARAATFDVSYDSRQVLVCLIRGSAEVRPALRYAVYTQPVRQVLAGQSLSYRAADFSFLPVPPRAQAKNDAQWPSGWATYRSIPLSELVSEANRYADQPIIIDGPGIGSLQASGRFRLTDTDAFARRIAEVFDLDVSNRADGIHLAQK